MLSPERFEMAVTDALAKTIEDTKSFVDTAVSYTHLTLPTILRV